MEIPQQYRDLVDAGKKNPLETYAATFVGALATDVASIEQAQTFLQGPLNELSMRKNNIPLTDVKILAFEAGPGGATGVGRFYDAADMLKAGFPADKKCRLAYLFSKGSLNPETVDIDPELQPTRTSRSAMFEVRDLVYMYYADSPDKVWSQIAGFAF